MHSADMGSPLVDLMVLECVGRLFALLSLKERLEGDELPKDAADGPDVHSWGVVLGSQEQLRRPVPDGDHHSVV